MLDELNNRIADVVHNITDAEGREREAERKIREADDDMENARAHRQAAESEKRAAAEDRARQVARFVALLEQALHDFRFMAGLRPDMDRRESEKPRPRDGGHRRREW
jgi:chromosome segregation ATPase